MSVTTSRPSLAGRWLYFSPAGTNLGEPRFTVYSRRGNFNLGTIEMRGQWQDWAFYPVADGVRSPLNREMLAEIHAFMREPGTAQATPGASRARWRLWLRERCEWLLRAVIRWL